MRLLLALQLVFLPALAQQSTTDGRFVEFDRSSSPKVVANNGGELAEGAEDWGTDCPEYEGKCPAALNTFSSTIGVDLNS